MSIISLKIEFGGGLELLFSNQRTHAITVPSHVPLNNRTDAYVDVSEKPNLTPTIKETKPADITYLIHHMRDHLLKEREELFMESSTVYVPAFSVVRMIYSMHHQPPWYPRSDQRYRLGT